jgi:hypothetical protein
VNAAGTTQARFGLAFEIVAAFLVLVFLGIALWDLQVDGFLPQPYFSDPNDSLMDGINTAYWANNSGAYDVWRTVYPPLSFVYSWLFSLHGCYRADAGFARDCDWVFAYSLLGFYLLAGVIVARSYMLTDRRTALPRTIAVTFGLPLTFALERGNLIVPCFVAFALGYGPVLRSARGRWFATALAVNFKPYLILPVLMQVFKGRWRSLEGALIAILLVYLATWILNGSGSPWQIYENILSFADDPERAASWGHVFYATTYWGMVQFVDSDFPLMPAMGSRWLEFADYALPPLIHAVQLIMGCAFFAAWIEPKAVPMRRLFTLGTLFTMISTDASGYSLVFPIFLVFFERWQGPARIIALVCAYILSIPMDWAFAPLGRARLISWLGNGPVMTDYGVTLGPFVRPGLVMICGCALAAGAIADVVRYRRAKRDAFAQTDAKIAPQLEV